ncbi:MAG: rhomboid family intramembrane serine protease [Lewinellaceae bacterium]|nr:rhomboid family intramembrane serine protease [Lewinellaceae bacterium]HRW75676.1 rhomboid family intramembrane serine protease [Saprospiraceae bacterium]
MLQSILEDVRREFRMGNMVTRLVIVNIVGFLTINLIRLVLWLGNAGVVHPVYYQIRKYLTLSSEPWFDLTHPWVLITSIFLHEGFWHLLWNMLFLFWFGRIVGDLIGNHRVMPLYLLGGIFAGLIFILSAQFLPFGNHGEVYALGASGAVMALVVAAGMIAPDYGIHLIIIGEVRLKYIVAVLVVLDLISLANDSNTGGHFAHLGGAFFGYLFIVLIREGIDLSTGVNSLMASIIGWFQPAQQKKGPRLVYVQENGKRKKTSRNEVNPQKKLDDILEKIKQKGIESLSAEERDFLEKQSTDS